MSHTVTVEQAAARLVELVRSIGPDDEIVLTQDDQPVARIVPQAPPISKPRQPGSARGLLEIVAEDDEHLEDFKDYMPQDEND